jgi:hypothetical protein
VGYLWVALASVGLLLSIAQPASAATELAGAGLEVERGSGAEDCPAADALRIRTLGLGTPRAGASEPMRVYVEFSKDEAGYHATVRTEGRNAGTRELFDAGTSCGPLAAATSLVLAVVLDLRPRAETEPAPRADSPPSKPEPAPPASKARPALVRFVGLGVHASGAYGLLGPGVTGSFGGDVRLRLSFLELEVAGFGALNRTVAYAPGYVEVGVAAGSAGICAYPLESGVELGACASFFAGRIHASGHGFSYDGATSSLWLASRVGITVALPLTSHWVARLGADLFLPLRRYSLVVERVGTVYDPSAAGFALSFGPEVRFL